ncbi:MAG: GNAT family N-acetyltransferase [Slackia sp.]
MASITEMPVQKRTEAFVDTLVSLWRRSVEASHRFLAKGDIERIEPEAREGIEHVETLYVAWADADEKTPAGFAGVQDAKLEMLFVDADLRGNGYGSLLLDRAIDESGVDRLDVNEDNVAAVEFYRAKSFDIESRSDFDDAGRPYGMDGIISSKTFNKHSKKTNRCFRNICSFFIGNIRMIIYLM